MADKKITDLQLIDVLEAGDSFPVDDAIQTYRTTATQIKNFVLPDGGLELEKLSDALVQLLTPTASVSAYAASTAPAGWLLCNGAAVSRTTYAALFDKIGVTHGQGDGSTTFNLPDYQGRFLRGTANGSTRDQDRALRVAMNTGGNTGDNVGSVQGHAVAEHSHNHPAQDSTILGSADRIASGDAGTGTATTFSFPMVSPGSETRPINAYVNYIIKT